MPLTGFVRWPLFNSYSREFGNSDVAAQAYHPIDIFHNGGLLIFIIYLGGCYPASVDNTLLDLHNISYPTKAEFNNCFIIHSK